ncbi:unnamed protein product [Paramecium octaurelia]|uniref:Uncharacterized protein n=1 Tax=Paramecium octaurelia TaxID=43137 RepID=A0A8S1TZ05_PAROT|nr:unnamed protein product [Paramecium octaurelia]
MHNLLLEEQNNNNNNKQQSKKNRRLDRVDIYPQIVVYLIQKKMHQLNQKLQTLVKEFLTTKLYSSQVQIQNLEDLIVDSSDTLKYEKSVNLKLQSKINILQNQLSISELQRQDVKENLSKLNSKSNKIISSIEQERALLQDEKDILLGHKKVLIRSLQIERNDFLNGSRSKQLLGNLKISQGVYGHH